MANRRTRGPWRRCGPRPDTREKKRAFFDYLAEKIRVANDKVWAEREYVQRLRDEASRGALDAEHLAKLSALARRYRYPDHGGHADAAWFAGLLERVDVVPASLILAQGANESAWGTSRFAREGRNFFGIWCYDAGCGITPRRRAPESTHEVRRYPTVLASVEHYVLMINTNGAYQRLRELRSALRANGEPLTGIDLTPGLAKYSERGQAYVDEIARMIRQNRLARYNRVRAAGVETADSASE